jgi:signal transduction histidine kinase
MVIKEGVVQPAAVADDLARVLKAIANRQRLAVVRLLRSQPATAREIAAACAISTLQARGHLMALSKSGLVQRVASGKVARYRLNGHVAARVNAALVYLLDHAEAAPSVFPGLSHPVGASEVLALTVPLPPDGCAACQNSSFVRRVLQDLDHVLAEARRHQSLSQQLSSQILGAHEAERKRIARELHDDTGQALTSILVRLRLLERTVQDEDIRRSIAELRELTSNALDAVRRMAVDLRPAALDDLGLVPALRSYADRFSRHWGVEVEFTAEGLQRRLPASVELVLYRVVQEALANVAKHSGAKRAYVSLVRRNNVVTAKVRDDGQGFDEQAVQKAGGGLGLFGMRERLALVGGSLIIDTMPGSGTLVTARVPLYKGSEGHA